MTASSLVTALEGMPFLVAVGLGTLLDHSGLPLPLLAGAAAAPAFGVDLGLVVLAAGLGAFAGDVILLAIGRRLGRETLLAGRIAKALGKVPGNLLDAVAARPVRALALYRYIPAIGKYAPLAAGAGGIAWPRGLLLSAIGSAVYAALFGVVGWLLQPAFVDDLRDARGLWGPIVAGVAIAAVLALALLARRSSKNP